MAKQKTQKHRRPAQEHTGSSGARPARASGSAASTPRATPSRASLRDLSPREDLAAASRREGDPRMLVVALLGTTVLVGAYYHLLVLQQMTQLTGGLATPDSLLFYGQDHVAALAGAMDEAARGQLNWVHKTAGVIFALAVGLCMAVVGAWRLRPPAAKGAALALGVVYAVVDIVENVAIEQAIAAGGPGAGLAAALTFARWVLLALIVLAVLALLWRGRRRRA